MYKYGMSFPGLARLVHWYGVRSTANMGKLAQNVNAPNSGPDRKSVGRKGTSPLPVS